VPGCSAPCTDFLPTSCSGGTVAAAKGTASGTATGDGTYADAGVLKGDLG
jgi:hypothetical protein